MAQKIFDLRATRALGQGMVGAVLLFALALFDGSIPPRVEDPIPDSIGLGFPFVMAGAGGVLAGVIYARAPEQRRDSKIRIGGLVGFWLGLGFYVVALVIQVGFSL